MKKTLHIILAATPRGEIGYDNQIPWLLSGDIRRFKQLTMGNVVIMGRKTYLSLLNGLNGRYVIVVSKSWAQSRPATLPLDVKVVGSLGHAIELANLSNSIPSTAEKIFIAGGVRLYKEAWYKADYLHYTCVFEESRFGKYDAIIPDFNINNWTLTKNPNSNACFKQGPDIELSYIYYEAIQNERINPMQMPEKFYGFGLALWDSLCELPNEEILKLAEETNKRRQVTEKVDNRHVTFHESSFGKPGYSGSIVVTEVGMTAAHEALMKLSESGKPNEVYPEVLALKNTVSTEKVENATNDFTKASPTGLSSISKTVKEQLQKVVSILQFGNMEYKPELTLALPVKRSDGTPFTGTVKPKGTVEYTDDRVIEKVGAAVDAELALNDMIQRAPCEIKHAHVLYGIVGIITVGEALKRNFIKQSTMDDEELAKAFEITVDDVIKIRAQKG